MELDLIKDSIEYEQSIAQNNVKLFVKEEYVIPDILPDVNDILMLDVKPMITTKEVSDDRLGLGVQLQYNIIYMARENGATEAQAVNYTGNIMENIDMPGAENGTFCEVDLSIEHMDCIIINERKIAIQGFMLCKCNGYKINSFEIVKDVQEGKDIEFLKTPMTLDKVIQPIEGEMQGKAEIKIDMDKGECLKVVKYNINIAKKEVRIFDGGIKIEAVANVCVLYKVKGNRDLCCVCENVPLYKEITVDELKPNMDYYTDFIVQSVEYDIRQDDMGENRIIDVEFIVKTNTHVMYKEEVEIIQDGYSPNKTIDMEVQEYNVYVIQGQGHEECLVKGDIDIKSNSVKPNKIIMTTGSVSLIDKKVKDDKVEIEGLLKVNVLYSTEDEKEYVLTMDEEIPFSCKVHINGIKPEMNVLCTVCLEMIEGNLEAGNVSIRAIVRVHCKAGYDSKKKFLVDMKAMDGDIPKKKASIIIYVVQPGDTLWQIAKNYFTTMGNIIEINDLNEGEEVKPGQKLIIPGRAVI